MVGSSCTRAELVVHKLSGATRQNMSGIKGGFALTRSLRTAPGCSEFRAMSLGLIALLLTLLMAAPALAADAAALERVRQMAEAAARLAAPRHARGGGRPAAPTLRLRLAPASRCNPTCRPAWAMWGRTRVGLRCVDGVARWAITVPVRVKARQQRPWWQPPPAPAGTALDSRFCLPWPKPTLLPSPARST